MPTGRTSSVLDHLSSIPNGDYSRAGNKKSSVTAHDLEMLLLLLLLMSGVVSTLKLKQVYDAVPSIALSIPDPS